MSVSVEADSQLSDSSVAEQSISFDIDSEAWTAGVESAIAISEKGVGADIEAVWADVQESLNEEIVAILRESSITTREAGSAFAIGGGQGDSESALVTVAESNQHDLPEDWLRESKIIEDIKVTLVTEEEKERFKTIDLSEEDDVLVSEFVAEDPFFDDKEPTFAEVEASQVTTMNRHEEAIGSDRVLVWYGFGGNPAQQPTVPQIPFGVNSHPVVPFEMQNPISSWEHKEKVWATLDDTGQLKLLFKESIYRVEIIYQTASGKKEVLILTKDASGKWQSDSKVVKISKKGEIFLNAKKLPENVVLRIEATNASGQSEEKVEVGMYATPKTPEIEYKQDSLFLRPADDCTKMVVQYYTQSGRKGQFILLKDQKGRWISQGKGLFAAQDTGLTFFYPTTLETLDYFTTYTESTDGQKSPQTTVKWSEKEHAVVKQSMEQSDDYQLISKVIE